MSPSTWVGFPREPCQVCRQPLAGPLVVCASCSAPVHGQCAVAVGHNVLCKHCVQQLQYDDEQRRQQHRAAHNMGLLTARGSECVGAALGAAGAASLAAGRYLVAGAAAGARTAWAGSGQLQPPAGFEVRVPRPASLPQPIAGEPTAPSNDAAVASEGAGLQSTRVVAAEAAERERQLENRLQQMEDRMVRLMASTEASNERHRQEVSELNAQLQARGAQIATLMATAVPSEVSAREYDGAFPDQVDIANLHRVPDHENDPDLDLYHTTPGPASNGSALQHARAAVAASAGTPLGVAAASSLPSREQPASYEPLRGSLPPDGRGVAAVSGYGVGSVEAVAESRPLEAEPGGESRAFPVGGPQGGNAVEF